MLDDDKLAIALAMTAVSLDDRGRELQAGQFDQSDRQELADMFLELADDTRPDETRLGMVVPERRKGTMVERWLEVVAMVLHDRRHRMGTGSTCEACLEDARSVLQVLGVRLTPAER